MGHPGASGYAPGHQVRDSAMGCDRNGRMAGVQDRDGKKFRKTLDEKVIVDRDRGHRTQYRDDRFV
jgi:hypothetical protein